jgi:hypothetical protein
MPHSRQPWLHRRIPARYEPAAVIVLALLPFGIAWAVSGGPDSGGRAAAQAPTPAYAPWPAELTLVSREGGAPRAPRVPRATPVGTPTEAQLVKALKHPLVGRTRAQVLAVLGQPAERATEAGALVFWEYRVQSAQFQVVLLDDVVVEVNRFR